MVKLEHPLSKNMELVATHDLNGQPGFQMALQVMNGHYYLYVTTYYHQGWQILDVTDPKHIICKHLDDPRGKSGTVHPKIQIADGIMITASGQRVRFLPMEGVDYDDYDSGIEIWDVKTDPMNPKLLGYWDNGGGEGIDGNNTHRNYYDGGRYVYTTSTCPGFLNNILRIIDIIDPANPKEVGRWYLKEQWLDGMDHVEWDTSKIQPGSLSPYPGYKHYHLHMPQVKDGYAYLAYCGYGLVILDVHDVTRPKYVGSLKIDPPFSDFISCHTALPMSGYNKDYLILTQEMGGDGRHAQFAGIVDISDKTQPTLVSMFPPYSVPEDAPFKNYVEKGGRPGLHNFHQPQGQPHYENRPDCQYLTCFNGGIRVYDTSDIFNLREIAYYIPADPEKDAWPIPKMMNDGQIIARCEDVLVDDRGYIYMTDSNGGLSVLRCLV